MTYYPGLKKIESENYSNPTKTLQNTAIDLCLLRSALQEQLPARVLEGKLLISTLNIRDFHSEKGYYGKRTTQSMHYLAELLSAFDIVALQEVGDKNLMKKLMRIMGKHYKYVLAQTSTSRKEGYRGLGFVYDTRKVKLEGDISEIDIAAYDGGETLVRNPCMATFRSGWSVFSICTLHVFFGSKENEDFKKRLNEVKRISEYFGSGTHSGCGNQILLGDFNIPYEKSAVGWYFEKAGFNIPDGLRIRTGTSVQKDKYYDQIFYRFLDGKALFTDKGGVFDYFRYVYNEEDMEMYYEEFCNSMKGRNLDISYAAYEKAFLTWRTFQMSDHLPLYAEIDVDFSENYLMAITGDPFADLVYE